MIFLGILLPLSKELITEFLAYFNNYLTTYDDWQKIINMLTHILNKNKIASSVMAKPSLCLGLLGMREKLDISLKKTFARFCDKYITRTEHVRRLATRRPRQEMAWPSKSAA